MEKRSEFGTLLNELIKKSGKSKGQFAYEINYSTTQISNALSGKLKINEKFLKRVISYFSELGIDEDNLEKKLRDAALKSQNIFAIEKPKDKRSDLRLNRYKHNFEEPMVLLKVQTMIARENVGMATILISKLENMSSELLQRIISMI